MSEKQYVYNQNLVFKAEQKTFKKIDSFKVMQTAAKACYSFILKKADNKKILVICGPGNNGGDGVLIAKALIEKNFSIDIFFH